MADDLKLTPEELDKAAADVLHIIAYQRANNLLGKGPSLSKPASLDVGAQEVVPGSLSERDSASEVEQSASDS